eukprot:TRINITY_DN1519_c0_g1_i1.p1 TRINITY_DN1519_c0_g1~~TRINITY_DN1519_c0_g1_i1.p1  ORF type:complete len:338 (+),score=77.43 TRINITY_DN1519_c0_g1_i1:44-1057(+)
MNQPREALFFEPRWLECPICEDYFEEAVETSCGHAFCEYCLNKWMERKVICPVCSKDPSPVHPSFTIRQLVQALMEQTASATGEPPERMARSANEEKELGNECYRNGQFAEAIKHYTRAIRKASNSVDNSTANMSNDTNQNSTSSSFSSSSFSSSSISSSPSTLHFFYSNRAACYIKLGQFKRAIEDCDEAIRLQPKEVKPYIRKCNSQEKIGDYIGALRTLDAAHRVDKESGNVWKEEIVKIYDRIKPIISQITGAPLPEPRSNQPGEASQWQQLRSQWQQFESWLQSSGQNHPPSSRSSSSTSTTRPSHTSSASSSSSSASSSSRHSNSDDCLIC